MQKENAYVRIKKKSMLRDTKEGVVLRKVTTARQSNIELLRIFAMLLIIAHHIGVHSGFDLEAEIPTFNRLWIQFIQMGGKIGVNVFVLISGYFLVTAQSLKLHKVIKLWLQLITYALLLFGLFVALGRTQFSTEALLNCFRPITKGTWWFASTYFVLFLLSPYINMGLNVMSKGTYRGFLLLLFMCWCIIPTFTTSSFQSNSLLWFVFLYTLAGYIRLHVDLKAIKPGRCFITTALLVALTWILATHLDRVGVEDVFNARSGEYFYHMQNLPILLISTMLFLSFLAWDIGHIPFVNLVSSATFAVYLLHDYGPMRKLLWKVLFENTRYAHRKLLIPYTGFQILEVFGACVMIELLRIYVIERAYVKYLEPLSQRGICAVKKIFSAKIFDKLKMYF